MKVTEIYLDLQKAEKKTTGKKQVRRLASESFKEPLKLQIQYEPEDLKYVEDAKKAVDEGLKTMQEIVNSYKDKEVLLYDQIEELKKENEQLKKNIARYEKEEDRIRGEKIRLISDTEVIRTQLKNLNGKYSTIYDCLLDLQKDNEKKAEVFTGQIFITGTDPVVLEEFEIQPGNYILRKSVVILEKNEYVANENLEIQVDKVGAYNGILAPMWNLRSTTALDEPTATIQYTLVLIPE